MKKLFALIFVVCMALPFAACGSKKELIPVQAVSFHENSVELLAGESVKLQYKIFPSNATNQNVQFFSSDPSAVSVSQDGVATLNRNQSAVITVRTLDGLFESTCMVSPLAMPDALSVDQTKTEQKYIQVGDTTKNVFMLSVGQTKILPVDVTPSTATKESFEFSIEKLEGDACIEIEKGAEWLVRAKSAGKCLVVVKTKNPEGNQISTSFEVWVSQASDEISLYKSGTSILNDDSTLATASFEVGQSEYLRIETSKNSVVSEHVSFKLYQSSSDIFEAVAFDTLEQFNELSLDATLFNTTKYIKIIPKATGNATLFLVSDSLDAEGNPFTIRVDIYVGEEPSGALATVVTDKVSKNGSAVVSLGESFSLDVSAYLTVTEGGESVNRPISIDGRKVYFSVSNASAIKMLEVDGSYSETNMFVAQGITDASSPAKIIVYVAKNQEVANLSEGNLSDYVSCSVDVYVQNSISTLAWAKTIDGVASEWLPDGAEIALEAAVDEEIDIACFGLSSSGEFVNISNTAWDFSIVSDNANVVSISDGVIKAKTLGRAKIVIALTTGVQVFERTIIINIV